MKQNILTISTLLLILFAGFACYTADTTAISNRLTSFVDPTTVNLDPAMYKISNPTGNILRDAVRILEKDSRTQGEFESLSLLERSLDGNSSTFQFLAKSKEFSDYTNTPITQLVTIQIQESEQGPFYNLSFGSNP